MSIWDKLAAAMSAAEVGDLSHESLHWLPQSA